MSEFGAYVTRIVGSVVADPRRRLAMRQELLNHLDEVYAEEIKREPSEYLAVETSIQRLGNPEELIRELQLSVPFRDIAARALRWATVSLVLQCILFLPLSAIATLDAFAPPGEKLSTYSDPASVRFLLTALVSAQVVIALVVFVLTLLHFWRQRATRLHGHPFLVSFVCATATGLTVLASGALLHLVITGGMFFQRILLHSMECDCDCGRVTVFRPAQTS